MTSRTVSSIELHSGTIWAVLRFSGPKCVRSIRISVIANSVAKAGQRFVNSWNKAPAPEPKMVEGLHTTPSL